MEFKILEQGSTGSDVQLLQQMLKLLYLFPGTITGSFGPETTVAVKSFQARYGLPITGIVDQSTWNEIVEANQVLERFKNNNRQERPTLRLGSNGEYVTILQTELKQLNYYSGNITGSFNTETENAVKAFQANNKLIADGIVGRNTWNALTYLYSPLAICADEEPKETNVYIVKQGDTLYSIARAFDMTVDEIKDKNNLISNMLQIGQELLIQQPLDSTKPDESEYSYIVKSGDTLYSIARRYNLTVDEIKAKNNLTGNTLQIGQELLIHQPVDIPIQPEKKYVVRAGDTLYSIAQRYNTTVDEIKRINNLTSNTLTIGQQLNLPSSEEQIYTVVAGDTIYSIARRFNTTINDIKDKNNLTSNIISIGQIVRI